MKWDNVRLIFSREMRDQMRDRRTLFTVLVMPMVLYPLMGMAMLQVGQFMREYPTNAWLIGAENLPSTPALIVDGQLNGEFAETGKEHLLTLQLSDQSDQQLEDLISKFRETPSIGQGAELVDQLILQEMKRRRADIAVYFPKPAVELDRASNPDGSPENPIRPDVFIFHNSSNDNSRMGAERFNLALNRWNTAIIQEALAKNDVPLKLLNGIERSNADVADKSGKRAALWSKVLPFIIVIWSLTGAFYPAIDLCAGEKERGTFETLLSSPAARSEIAIGKLLTVMSFSMVTSLLNLISMGLTGMFVVGKFAGSMSTASQIPFGFPPLEAFLWLVIALVPISALFSAVALAAAAFARSSKEGQYYLVPLMMFSMPLMMVPMLPAARLDLGTSLIPVSGLMLLLRGLIEGQYSECLQYFGPVCAVTIVCCWLSIRWVVSQFNSETVLFRASERFNLRSWLHSVMEERHALPTIGNALLCGVLILVTKFFIGLAASTPVSFFDFSKQTIIILVASVGIPAVLMALILTRDPRRSLRLNWCSMPAASAAILAAIMLNPLFTWLAALVMQLYPPAGNMLAMEQSISAILNDAPGIWAVLIVLAIAPAVIEETAFRGFILSGLESFRSKWHAIILTSLLFGIAHSIIQQSIITFFVGMILGTIAVQTRSILPCICFHGIHNSLAVLLSQAKPRVIENSPLLRHVLFTEDGQHYQYAVVPGILMGIVGVALLVWFIRLPSSKTKNADLIPNLGVVSQCSGRG